MDGGYVADEHIDSTRWTEVRRMVFESHGKLWAVDYERGLTEYQEVDPFNDYPRVIALQVEPYQVEFTKYRMVG